MKLKFKTQAYQSAAVQAVVDCFQGQVPHHHFIIFPVRSLWLYVENIG